MKKIFVLLMIPLLITGLFAATSTTTSSQTGMLSQGMNLMIQNQLLEAMNTLNVTSGQASIMVNSLVTLKTSVNALEKQRVSDLTALRDALVSNDATQIKSAKAEIANLNKEYRKTVLNLVNSLKSTVTLEQAGKVFNFARKMMADHNFMNFRNMPQNRREWANPQNGFNQMPKPRKEPANPQNKTYKPQNLPNNNREQAMPWKMPWMQNFQHSRTSFQAMENFLPEFLYNAVNSQLFDLLVNTLELRAK